MAYDYNLLEKFASNDKKQKIYTIVYVVVLLLLLGAITYLIIDNINKKNELYIKKQHNENINKSFSIDIDSLEEEIEYYKSKTNRVDTLLIIDTIYIDDKYLDFKVEDQTISTVIKNSNIKPMPNITTQFKKGNVMEQVKVSNHIIKQIKLPTVYIQYCCSNNALAKNTQSFLANTKSYNVPPIEGIDFSFNSTIKYFNESDRELANKLLETLKSNTNNEISTIFKNIKPDYVKMLAPEGQLEIWIGK